MIVVDTNVIAYLWLPCPETASAQRALELDGEWCAPLLWRSEFRNVLAGVARSGAISLEAARRTADDAEAQMRGREFAVETAAVLAAAATSNCSAYDCEFVVLARALDVPLITADRQVLRAFPGVAQSLARFVGR